MRSTLPSAAFAAVIMFVLTFPLLGLKLHREGVTLGVSNADTQTWLLIGMGVAVVFFFQLFRSAIVSARQRIFALRPSHGRFDFNDGFKQKFEKIALIALLGLALIWPFISGRFSIDLATLVLIYVMLGLGLNIVVGFAGLLDLGYVAFYAVGAYSYALLSQYWGVSFWIALPIGGLLAAFAGLLLGFPVLRLRGDYLAIVTLGFGEIIREMLNIHTELTGGPNGIGGIPQPTLPAIQLNPEPALVALEFGRRAKQDGNLTFHEFFGLEYSPETKLIFLYLMALVLVLITLFVIRRLSKMPVGRAWEALREDEIASRSLGLNKTGIKLSAFTIGASFAGFAGCFFAARQGFISPESFTFMESAIILAIVVLGGMGSQIGVICAAVVMIVLPALAQEFDQYRMLIFGAMMVLMMIWRPEGLLPVKRAHMRIKASQES